MGPGFERWDYDVSRDGQRFILVEPEEEPPRPPLRLWINWQAAITQPSSERAGP